MEALRLRRSAHRRDAPMAEGARPPPAAASTSFDLGIRALSTTEFEIMLAKGIPTGAATLYLSSGRSEIRPLGCSASYCGAEQHFVLTAPLTIR